MQKETLFFFRDTYIHDKNIFKKERNDKQFSGWWLLLVSGRKGNAVGKANGGFEEFGNVIVLKLSNKVHRYLSYYLK